MGVSATYLNTIDVNNTLFSCWASLFSSMAALFVLAAFYITPEKMKELNKRYFWAVFICFILVFTILGLYFFLMFQDSIIHIMGIIILYLPSVFLLRSALKKAQSQDIAEGEHASLSMIARSSRPSFVSPCLAYPLTWLSA